MERSGHVLTGAIGARIELRHPDHILDLTDVEADIESVIERWSVEGDHPVASRRGEAAR